MRKLSLWAVLLMAVVAFTSCGQAPEAKKQIAEHVIYIGLAGWGSYSVAKADKPNVKPLMAEGCYTLEKRAVLPSSSGVNWASMFMGAWPDLL